MEIVFAILVGIGLSVSAGFRVFSPFLVLSLMAKFEILTISSNFDWVTSTPAIIALSVATIVEMLAYYIPIVDNFLKAIASPVALVAGILLVGISLDELDPVFSWAIAIIGGGSSATVSQLVTTGMRGLTTAFTGGFGNFILNIFEDITAVIMALVAIAVPIASAIILIIMLMAFIYFIRKYKKMRINKVKTA